MIKINISLVDLDKLAQDFYSEVINYLDIINVIDAKVSVASANGQLLEFSFYSLIQRNLDRIIKGQPDELERLSTGLSASYKALENDRIANKPANFTAKHIKAVLKSEVLEIFNYDFFTKNNNGKWAYEHSKILDVKVCLYCNSQYTFTVKSTRGKTRPQFDHFFYKSKFPFFALSFYNLIPSCYVCNSNLKGQKVFKPSTHIHPFIEGTEDTIKFKISIKAVDFLVKEQDFDITIANVKKANAGKLVRANRSCNVFHISEVYDFHKDYVGEIIYKSYLYTDSKIMELLNAFHADNGVKLFKKPGEITEMLFGNHLTENKLHKRPLSKLTMNIANELGVKLL